MQDIDVASLPRPGCNIPTNIKYSPDGSSVTFLYSPMHNLTRSLYHYSKDNGIVLLSHGHLDNEINSELSLEEQLMRERKRMMGKGITNYTWNPNGTDILLPLNGSLYTIPMNDDTVSSSSGLQDKVHENECIPLQSLLMKENNFPILDPQYSPNGKYIAFVLDQELHVISSKSSSSKIQLTFDARNHLGKSNGLACFLTQEELSRYSAFWWSPDSLSIVFEAIDTSQIPSIRLHHLGQDSPHVVEDHVYPFAGGPNPKRKLGVVVVETKVVTWLNTGEEDSSSVYYPRINWLNDNKHVILQRMNREQTMIELVRCNVNTGTCVVILQETSDVWINPHDLFTVTSLSETTFEFLWGSERTGMMHLYYYTASLDTDVDATCLRTITSGDWIVESVVVQNNSVYFSSTKQSVLEKHYYSTCLLDQDDIIQMTSLEGMHTIIMHPNHTSNEYIDTYSSLNTPPQVSIVNDETTVPIFTNTDPRLETLHLPPPTLFTFPSTDGKVTLHGAIYLPDASVYGPGPYPTLVHVYGGPHVQRVTNSWGMNIDMRSQRLVSSGYVVLKVDNRGSFRRGLFFEGYLKNNMGCIEVEDQVAAVEYQIKQGLVDNTRVGIFGWSYGGYLSLMCLLKANSIFKLAVSGAPVTSWDGYDSCYTERYMSTPELNKTGYKDGNVMNFVHQMKEDQKLLLVHGLMDENVHFRHTARLMNACITSRKKYDVLLFPNERHSPRSLEDRMYMEERIFEYISKHL